MVDRESVYVPEGTFGVLDAGEIPVQTADWTNGLAVPMSRGALVATGIHTGDVRVGTSVMTSPAVTSADASWEEIVEISVHAPAGLLKVESLEKGPVVRLPLLSRTGPGWYRLRVHARGRSMPADSVSTEPAEDYLLELWPSPPADVAILRSSDRIAFSLGHSDKTSAPAPDPVRSAEQEAIYRRLMEG
ncbi:hypothetical protein [Streptomyces sp. MMBL 11-3]|uniref:hypothetical protein n=1 Tax=Streptomyces sp. MMBL 11-3 TaxID=3382639 RepID=UPI0039B5D980